MNTDKIKERYREIYNNLYTVDERKELVAEAIKNFRILSGMTQKEVCEIINIGLPTYNTYETGRSAAPLEIVVRLAHLYNIDPALLLQFDNFAKDKMKQTKMIEEYEKDLSEIKEKIKKATPEEQAAFNILLEKLGKEMEKLKS